MWQLRYQVNKFTFNIVATYNSASLAYGMRKKYSNMPGYHFNRLKVVKL